MNQLNTVGSETINLLSPLLNLLPDEERRMLERSAEMVEFKRHEIIYREGESPNHLYLVVEGAVKVYREGVCGRCQIMRMLGAGSFFGYRASLAHEPYVTGAAAFGPATICCVPMNLIHQVMAKCPSVMKFFVEELAKDLGVSDKRMVSLTQKHVRGRIAESLLTMREVFGLDTEGFIDLDLTRQELADYSNMTTSNAIRTISALVSESVISVKDKRIKLLEDELLLRISLMG
jgi:CRP-like cAMP-binding protein